MTVIQDMMRLTNKRTATQEAVRILSRRALSKKELQSKLMQKGFKDGEIKEAV